MTSSNKKCPHIILKESLHRLILKFRGSTCMVCSYPGKNQWLCLHDGCYFVGCGSKGGDHGTSHSLLKNHPVSVNLHNSQLFCQKCNSEVFLNSHSLPSGDAPNSRISSSVPACTESGERPLGTCGLPNLGNTCYMNAALQAISNCPQLTEYFLQCSGLFDTNRPGLLSRYRDFLSRVWLPPRSSLVSPLSLVHEMKCLYPMFGGFSQHDSQEFLRLFLNHLHDELNSTHSNTFNQVQPSTQPIHARLDFGDRSAQCDQVAIPMPASFRTNGTSRSTPASQSGRSIITDVFQGKLISAVRCLSCNLVSCREEVFLDLSLSLMRPDINRPVESDQLAKARASRSEPTAKPPPSTVDSHPVPEIVSRCGMPPPSLSTSKRSLRYLALSTPVERLSNIRSTIPLARRLILQLFGLIAISFAWVVARFTDLQGWMARPALSLTDCLSDYFSVAELNGENKYYCERCKKHCNGLNQTALFSLPEVLCLHLKRFRSHSTDTSKITSPVVFPLVGLEMKPYLHPDCADKVTTYDLIGVICHRGDCGGGHYVACALNWHQNAWFEFDDDHVFPLRPDQVEQLTTEAYVLFYRKSDSGLASIRKEADLLFHQYSSGSLHSMVYLSRPWFVRFCTCAEPGPISNADFLCEHNFVRPQLACNLDPLLFPVPEELWVRLIHHFGGGPVIREITACSICHDALLSRQHQELMAFDRVFEKCEMIADFCGLYAISSAWFDTWKDFVGGKTLKIPDRIDNSDIADYGPPSYLFNSPLYTTVAYSSTSRSSQPRLKIGSAYNQLFGGCWELLVSIYGGGPAICVRQPEPLPSSKIWHTTEDDLSDSLSGSPQSLILGPGFHGQQHVSELDSDLSSRRNQSNGTDSAVSQVSASISTSLSSPSILNNGDSESGVFSAGLTSCSNFSSSVNGTPFCPTNHHRVTSLSFDNLASLAQGDWRESAVSLYSNGGPDKELPVLNGYHSQSDDQLHAFQPKTPLPMAGDSSVGEAQTPVLLCNGVSTHLPDSASDLKQQQVSMRI